MWSYVSDVEEIIKGERSQTYSKHRSKNRLVSNSRRQKLSLLPQPRTGNGVRHAWPPYKLPRLIQLAISQRHHFITGFDQSQIMQAGPIKLDMATAGLCT